MTRTVVRDGRVRTRALRPDEAWVVREVFAGLSPESVYRRFHAPLHRLSAGMVAHLTAVDGTTHVAVVAEARSHDGWRPVGIGRLARAAEQTAEVAVAVVDDFQGRGIGRMLLTELRDVAPRLGYREVLAWVLLANEPALGLLHAVFTGATTRQDGDTVEFRAPLAGASATPDRRPRRHRPPRAPRYRGRRSRQRLPMVRSRRRAMVVVPDPDERSTSMSQMTTDDRNGVDVATLFATLDAVKAQRELAAFRFRAKNRWLSGTHSQSTSRGFYGAGQEHEHARSFVFDADHPAVLVGKDNGPTPVEYLLYALASCLTAGIANIASARGVTLTRVESTLEGDIDLQGILGMSDEVRNGYQRIRIRFTIEGDAPAETLREIVEQSRARSAVYDVLTYGVPVEIDVAA